MSKTTGKRRKKKRVKLDNQISLSPDVRPLLKGLKLTGYESTEAKRILAAGRIMRNTRSVSLKPLLPLLLNLKGKPYTLDDHFPFVPFFKTLMPRKTVLICGRQVSKSTSLASHSIVVANCIPYFSALFVTPLYEMIRRFSNNYVRPFIDESPLKDLLTGTKTVQSVLQRTFKNHSQLFFSFCFLTADRVRGLSVDRMCVDECQDIDSDFLPIMRECMSHSSWGLEDYTGTPKTLANTLYYLWINSSQAQWVIKCHRPGCGYWNVPSLEQDLIAMIGPVRDDISEKRPGVLCRKCRIPLLPRPAGQGGFGRWSHAFPERKRDFTGYHVPQIVMPLHYSNVEKWKILKGKQEGAGNTRHHVFLNEVCGEACDTGTTLVTITDLKSAATLPPRTQVDAIASRLGDWTHRLLSVDWGGGGEQWVSFTSLALVCRRPDGVIEVPWGHRSLTPHDHMGEAEFCLEALSKFRCQVIAHDYTGAGALRETFIAQAGFPYNRIIPIAYVRAAAGGIIVPKPPTEHHPRHYYQVDKTRSLQMTSQLLKSGLLKTFAYDYKNEEDTGLLHDFLALVEEKVDSRLSRDIYTIVRNPMLTDDFAQAVNIGCMAMFHMTQQWPNIATPARMQVDQAALDAVNPSKWDWEDV